MFVHYLAFHFGGLWQSRIIKLLPILEVLHFWVAGEGGIARSIIDLILLNVLGVHILN